MFLIVAGWFVAIMYVYCFYAKKFWDAEFYPEDLEDEEKSNKTNNTNNTNNTTN